MGLFSPVHGRDKDELHKSSCGSAHKVTECLEGEERCRIDRKRSNKTLTWIRRRRVRGHIHELTKEGNTYGREASPEPCMSLCSIDLFCAIEHAPVPSKSWIGMICLNARLDLKSDGERMSMESSSCEGGAVCMVRGPSDNRKARRPLQRIRLRRSRYLARALGLGYACSPVDVVSSQLRNQGVHRDGVPG